MQPILPIILSIIGSYLTFEWSNYNSNKEMKKENFPTDSVTFPDSTIYGLWKSNDSVFESDLIWIRKNKPLVLMQPIRFNSSIKYSAHEYSRLDAVGDCLFYYDSNKQSLIYFATYSNGMLTHNLNSYKIKYKRVALSDLNTEQVLIINNPSPDTLLIWGLRKPPIYGHYDCKDSTVKLSQEEDIYPKFTRDSASINR